MIDEPLSDDDMRRIFKELNERANRDPSLYGVPVLGRRPKRFDEPIDWDGELRKLDGLWSDK